MLGSQRILSSDAAYVLEAGRSGIGERALVDVQVDAQVYLHKFLQINPKLDLLWSNGMRLS